MRTAGPLTSLTHAPLALFPPRGPRTCTAPPALPPPQSTQPVNDYTCTTNASTADLFPQSTQPVFTQYDCDCLALLASEFEIDFVNMSFTRE